VARYEKVLFNVAYRMVHDAEDARDLAQGAFVKAYEKLKDYDPAHRFFSWIYRILVNDTLNLLKKRKPEAPLPEAWDGPSPVDGPDERLTARERETRVRSALMALTADYREAVVLRYFADLSYADMSAALAIPEKTVKSRLYSARQRLADLLEGRR